MSSYKGDRHYCSVEGCQNQKKNQNLSFFNLPKDVERRNEWLKIIGRPDLIHSKVKHTSYQVCSKHFEDSMMTVIQIRKLHPNAKPCKFVDISKPNTTKNDSDSPNKSDPEEDKDIQNQSTQTNESYINIIITEIKKENDIEAATGDAVMQTDANTQTGVETQIATASGSSSNLPKNRMPRLLSKQTGKLHPNAKPCKFVEVSKPNTTKDDNDSPNKSDSEEDRDIQNQSTQTNESCINVITEIKKENDIDAATGDAVMQEDANTQTDVETRIATASGSSSNLPKKRKTRSMSKQTGKKRKKQEK